MSSSPDGTAKREADMANEDRSYTTNLMRQAAPLGMTVLSQADAQALADVRTLDEWARKSPARHWRTWPGVAQTDVSLSLGQHEQPKEFYGPTPDAARREAAKWVLEHGLCPAP